MRMCRAHVTIQSESKEPFESSIVFLVDNSLSMAERDVRGGADLLTRSEAVFDAMHGFLEAPASESTPVWVCSVVLFNNAAEIKLARAPVNTELAPKLDAIRRQVQPKFEGHYGVAVDGMRKIIKGGYGCGVTIGVLLSDGQPVDKTAVVLRQVEAMLQEGGATCILHTVGAAPTRAQPASRRSPQEGAANKPTQPP